MLIILLILFLSWMNTCLFLPYHLNIIELFSEIQKFMESHIRFPALNDAQFKQARS
jgi:hypothetical protein